MPNIARIISGHNKHILKGQNEPPPCSCTQFNCPVEKKCETKGIIYQCQVKEVISGNIESYIGLSENTFKYIDIISTERVLQQKDITKTHCQLSGT